MSRKKKLLFSFFFFLFLLVGVEGFFRIRQFFRVKRLIPYTLSSEATLQLMESWPNWESSYTIYDPELGWRLRPSSEKKKEGFSYRTNAQGLRANREYSLDCPEHTLRIALFGDSFVHGDEVPLEQTFGSHLEALFPEKVEVLNFGVSGYGTDQSILLYENKGKVNQPQVVLLGFLTEHLARNVNRFRRFYVPEIENPFLSKPRFILKNNQLELLSPTTYSPNEVATFIRNQDLQTLSQGEYFYEPAFYYSKGYHCSLFLLEYETKRIKYYFKKKCQLASLYKQPEVLDLTIALLTRFVENARQENRVPFVFTLHFLQDFEKWNDYGHYWSLLVKRCVEAHIPIVDIGALLAQDQKFMQQPKKYYLPEGHYTAEMNARIAKILFETLSKSQEFELLKNRLHLNPK
ncbi:MAG: hypothetical protein AABZ60_21620 [Planctomycetota bacterium]